MAMDPAKKCHKKYNQRNAQYNSHIKTTENTLKPFNRKLPYDKRSNRWREVTNAVTSYIAKETLPSQRVEREGVKQLDPRYTAPGRKYFRLLKTHI